MDLKTFLKSLGDDGARERFAAQCETTHGHLRNCSYGKPLAPAACVLVEANAARAVMRWDLRPDDWWKIWPELLNAENAPTPANAEKVA